MRSWHTVSAQNRGGEVMQCGDVTINLGFILRFLASGGQSSTESGPERQVNCLSTPEIGEGKNSHHHVYRTTF